MGYSRVSADEPVNWIDGTKYQMNDIRRLNATNLSQIYDHEWYGEQLIINQSGLTKLILLKSSNRIRVTLPA